MEQTEMSSSNLEMGEAVRVRVRVRSRTTNRDGGPVNLVNAPHSEDVTGRT